MCKYLYINVLLILFLVNKTGFAQVPENQLKFADSLFKAQNYFDAITEYKRLLFFDGNNEYDFSANYKIALAYKFGAKYGSAINYFRIASNYAKLPEQKFNIELMIVRTNILRGTENVALQMLDDLMKQAGTVSKKKEIYYWRGWAYMFKDDWENASKSFAQINPNHKLKLLCDKVNDEKYSVTFAKVISYILPGFGQFYTGHYLSGLLSLGWNVLWGYTTVNAFASDRIFDGLVIANLLWFRFYRGNFQNAEKFAKQENLKITNKALYKIQTEYRGLKP